MTANRRNQGANQGTGVPVVVILVVMAVGGAALFLVGKQQSKSYPEPPLTLVDDSVPKTVQVAAERGWVPCPGNCLKLATPGWHHQSVEGHPDTDIWFSFRAPNGWAAYSQNHIGHIIRTYSDKPAEDVGVCPTCNGTGWVRKDASHPTK